MPQPNGIHPRFTRTFQYMQIDVIYHNNKSQKPHDHLGKCRKRIRQGPTSIHDNKKTLTKIGIEGTYKHNRSYL